MMMLCIGSGYIRSTVKLLKDVFQKSISEYANVDGGMNFIERGCNYGINKGINKTNAY